MDSKQKKIVGGGGLILSGTSAILTLVGLNVIENTRGAHLIFFICGLIALVIVGGVYLMFVGLFGKDERLELDKENLEIKKEQIKLKKENLKLKKIKYNDKMSKEQVKLEKKKHKEMKLKIDEIYDPLYSYLTNEYTIELCKHLRNIAGYLSHNVKLISLIIDYRKKLVNLEFTDDDFDFLKRLKEMHYENMKLDATPLLENIIYDKIAPFKAEIREKVEVVYNFT